MLKEIYDVVIIGGGPAGLAAAISAKKFEAKDVLLIDRETHLGGILQQCIHTGFGLINFGEDLTGPEYAHRYTQMLNNEKIDLLLDTAVLKIDVDKKITLTNTDLGMIETRAKAIVLAMGCRERVRGYTHISGFRPAGVFTAGTAQRLINIHGYLPGKEVVILGSGDIGLIMARRCKLEGMKVNAVVEKLSYPGGLQRNVVQCLEDFRIPLYLSHTVTFIHGKERVEGVTISEINSSSENILGTDEIIKCDTLLLSLGLIPEGELIRNLDIEIDSRTNGPIVDNLMQTTMDGIFACGNVVQVYDLVDWVSNSGETAGRSAALYSDERLNRTDKKVIFKPGKNVTSVVSQVFHDYKISENAGFVSLRVSKPLTNVHISFNANGKYIWKLKKRAVVPSEMLIIDLIKMKEELFNYQEIVIDVDQD
ncbi:MAG: NAD(P)/FAD-dependent oxidoreductase [Actinobacteria bacterium]|nr:NAD(P)/FAD-dependent oxidoreductase [Actinomycetota bacterium]